MEPTSKYVALVFGASGISGWAVTNNLFIYPTASTFCRIIGLTNRPMDLSGSQLPKNDPRLEIYSGINLREDIETVKEQMKIKIPNMQDITHVYYCAYSVDVMEIRNINVTMTRNAVKAVDEICSSLKFLSLQTGTNSYGVAVFQHQDKIEINPPLKESQPRIPSPYGDEIFYYGQVDAIEELQKGKSWRWCEVRPDAIVGFVPGTTSIMTFLEPIALFLALWRYVHGPGAEIKFIGTATNYTHTNTDSSQDIIAKSHIYLSTVKPEGLNGEAFNTADNATPVSWVERWPVMVDYFGLQGTPPVEGAQTTFPVEKWWEEHQDDYKRMCAEYGLKHRDIPAASWIFTMGTTAGDSVVTTVQWNSEISSEALGVAEDTLAESGLPGKPLISQLLIFSFRPSSEHVDAQKPSTMSLCQNCRQLDLADLVDEEYEVQDIILHSSIADIERNVSACDLCQLFHTSITEKLRVEGVSVDQEAWYDTDSPVILRGTQYKDEKYESRGLFWVKVRCDRLSPRAYCYFSFYPKDETTRLEDSILGRPIKPPAKQLSLVKDWVRECEDHHQNCHSAPATLPTRVVDVGVEGDSKEDWELESVKMGTIYASSCLTIAASASADSTGGCFLPRSTSNHVQVKCTRKTNDESVSIPVFLRPRPRDFSHLPQSILHSRAWVTQERLLSARMVHYDSDQLLWECRESRLAEDGVQTDAFAVQKLVWDERLHLSSPFAQGRLSTSEFVWDCT
ncbi:SirQ [Colletotrichum cuscutae]|uniref:SirQ n=1 Tax=Colletotrichum cuscutae TaxID=1209917 RepID=A0AAI9XPJ1_9PEZI|nr:SirQ [Colletotrichum cuscutae]